MRFLSVCSGIEAASCAWNPLGWEASAFSEIEPFPCSVLAHRFPTVPNRGDMTNFQDWPDESIDLLCGGTPCQSFSVAGLRKGLADPRGNLMLTYGAIAAKYRPRWLVWENVPGVLSSNGGRDFGSFLGLLGELGYGFAYRVLDAQHFGVPQRRRRVFVVGCLGDWRAAAAVLLERHSLSGHPAPRRESRQGVTGTLSARTDGGGGLGTDFELGGGLIPETVGTICADSHPGSYTGQDAYTGRPIAHALTGEGFDASEDGTGRGTPLVPVSFNWQAGGTQTTLGYDAAQATAGTLVKDQTQAIAFSSKDFGGDASADLAPTLRSMSHAGSHANGGGQMAVAFAQNQRDEVRMMHVAGALAAEPGAKQQTYAKIGMQVRRLTPTECERLQGFPDGWTDVPHRGKPAADGPRYKALGNSWAVPCAAWIGRRIEAVEAVARELEAA
jgi:DNA (cytosine-5)-methyltransferase 1